MAKCPKCRSEIEFLVHIESGIMASSYNGEVYEQDEFNPDDETSHYECPQCGRVVARNEEKAKEILSDLTSDSESAKSCYVCGSKMREEDDVCRIDHVIFEKFGRRVEEK